MINLGSLFKTAIITSFFTILLTPSISFAKNIACTGIAKTCTKKKPYDKWIDNKLYSCYDCSQTICASDGKTWVGIQKSSVCTEASASVQSPKASKQKIKNPPTKFAPIGGATPLKQKHIAPTKNDTTNAIK